MTIWLLALLLMGAAAGLGLRQGAIRVAFSFVGILVAALLAVPLGRLIRPVVAAVGVKNDTLLWVIPPLIIFVIVLILFKAAAFAVHHKVEVFYKYKAGDLRLALWERLNHRLGLCLGLANGLAYLVLVSFAIYPFSYWTVQVAAPNGDPRSLRILNRLGNDLQSSGMLRVARAIDRVPTVYYETADLLGILYRTPLLEARLYRYPAFLGLAERPEFQEVLNSKEFTEAWQRQSSIVELLKFPAIQAILKNAELANTVRAAVVTDLTDLGMFLTNGVSAKYGSEKIVGRWNFDLNGSIGMLRRARPNISSTEMGRWKQWMAASFSRTTLVAMTDNQALLKNLPALGAPAGATTPPEPQNVRGEWKKAEGKYTLSYPSPGGRSAEATVEITGDRMSLNGEGLNLSFLRED